MVAELPAATVCGEIAVIAATGLFTVNVAAGEVPPPGAGLSTVTMLSELPLRSAAGTAIVNWVALTNVALIAVPFHCTVEAEMNPVPSIVTAVSGAPATTEDGVSVAMAGLAFEVGGLTTGAGAAPPPPHPVINHAYSNVEARRTHGVRFIGLRFRGVTGFWRGIQID
jgi:hypothetical protein